jgi:hypothetical protein
MRNVMQSMLMAAALVASTMAATPGVRPVTSSRNTRALTAVNDSGQTYLAAREMQVDLDFPSGKSGKGKLFLLFEPSTGLFLHTYGWERNEYPAIAWIDDIETHSLVGVSADRLVIVNTLGIRESTEKAASLDDAEAKSLKWMNEHLLDVEARLPGNVRVASLQLDSSGFPKGFFREYNVMPGLPLKLVDMVRQGNGWDLTLESTEHHRRVKLLISPQGNTWVHGFARPDQAGK